MIDFISQLVSFEWIDSYDLYGYFVINAKVCWFFILLCGLWISLYFERRERKNGTDNKAGYP